MEYGDYQEIKQGYEALVKQSTLDVLIPKTKDISVGSLLTHQVEELQRTSVRDTIFFDEITSVLIHLRTTASESAIELLLPHLELTTSAFATNAAKDGGGNAASVASKHEISVKRIAAIDNISTAKVGAATHIVWTQSLHATRPRARLSRPGVYFTATLSLKADFLEQAARTEKHFLPSFQALPTNVLESLRLSSAQDDERMYMSEARITKVTPPSPRPDDDLRPLRGATKRILAAVPAIIPRLRCSAVSDKVFVSLQIEASQVLAGEITIQSTCLDVSEASIERIGNVVELSTLHAGEEIALLYKVVRVKSLTGSKTPGITSVSIHATAKYEQDTEVELSLAWQTQINLSEESSTKQYSWSGEGRPGSTDSGSTRRTEQQLNSSSMADALIFDLTAPKSLRLSSDDSFDLDIRCINNSKSVRHFAIRIAEPRASFQSTRNAIVVSPDVKVSPVGPGECFEAAVKYKALATGVLNLGEVRIVDLDAEESIKIHDLPDVVAYS